MGQARRRHAGSADLGADPRRPASTLARDAAGHARIRFHARGDPSRTRSARARLVLAAIRVARPPSHRPHQADPLATGGGVWRRRRLMAFTIKNTTHARMTN